MSGSRTVGKLEADSGIRLGKESDGASLLTRIVKGTVSINPASVNNAEASEESVTITGAAAGDIVILQPPAAGLTAGLLVTSSWVSAANTVKVRLFNASGAPINEAAGTWSYLLIK